METIKCKECGQVMGAASEVCPRCGTPVINETSKKQGRRKLLEMTIHRATIFHPTTFQKSSV